MAAPNNAHTAPAESHFVPTVSYDSIPPGKYVRWTGERRDILICRLQDGPYAIENMCSHQQMALAGGRLNGNKLMCPVHGGIFDVCTGAALKFPAGRPIKAYACQLVDGIVHVDFGSATRMK
jgi:nitrite reductase/ring-hydroxylating ferredoxin subunit